MGKYVKYKTIIDGEASQYWATGLPINWSVCNPDAGKWCWMADCDHHTRIHTREPTITVRGRGEP